MLRRLLNKNEIKSLEPNLKEIPKEAIFTSLEGAAEADRVALEMLNDLSKKGGKVLSGCTVSGLKFKKASVSAVQTNIGEMQCDMVAIATRAAMQNGLEGFDWRLPMQNKKGLIVQTAPLPELIYHVLMTNDVHFKQNVDGSLRQEKYLVVILKKAVVPLDLASDVISRISKKLSFTGNLIPTNIKIGERPFPIDGFPVIGDVQGYKGSYLLQLCIAV